MSSVDDQPDEPGVVETSVPAESVKAAPASGALKALRGLSIFVVVAGAILVVAGVATWFIVGDTLADEKIVVSDDAEHFAGDPVDGPLTAYVQADTIQTHALESSGGKTYAELGRDDPVRQTVMTASFLRASLFTSVVSFGVAAFAAAMGVLMIIIGYILLRLCAVVAATQQTAPAG